MLMPAGQPVCMPLCASSPSRVNQAPKLPSHVDLHHKSESALELSKPAGHFACVLVLNQVGQLTELPGLLDTHIHCKIDSMPEQLLR